ncbi:MAG: hypothetical protein LBG49_02320 [Mycoplasmataceae bacterium]|nr:hypothetical protein [Mycoplasmataceae bacterium]
MKQLGICVNLAIKRVFKVTSLKVAFIFSILWVVILFGILPLIFVVCSKTHSDTSSINPIFSIILISGAWPILFATFSFLFSVIENNELTLIFSRPIKRTTYISGKIIGGLLLSLFSVVLFDGLLATWTIINHKNGISFDTLYQPLGFENAKGIGAVGSWIVTLLMPYLWVTIGVCFGTLLGFILKRRWQNFILTLAIIIPWIIMLILPLLFKINDSLKLNNFMTSYSGGWVFCVIIPVSLWVIFASLIGSICKNKAIKQNIRA